MLEHFDKIGDMCPQERKHLSSVWNFKISFRNMTYFIKIILKIIFSLQYHISQNIKIEKKICISLKFKCQSVSIDMP